MKFKFTAGVLLLGIFFVLLWPGHLKEIFAAEAVVETVQEPALVKVAPVEPQKTYREGLAAYIISVNDTVSSEAALGIADCVIEQAEKYGIDEKLILAIAHTESSFYSDAVSCANYKGLMQTGDLLAEAAGYHPEALFDPAVSIAVGAGYIFDQLCNFDQDVFLALTAYNQGPGAVYEGGYDSSYAKLTLKRVKDIELFLKKGDYPRN